MRMSNKYEDCRCGTCKYIEKSRETFKVNARLICKNCNLIYCTTCQPQKENDLEQTRKFLLERIKVHKQHITALSVKSTVAVNNFNNKEGKNSVYFKFCNEIISF